MTVICHSRQFIFLKSRKTAGTSIELWLAPNLDPKTDDISTGIDLKQFPHLWNQFERPANKNSACPEACGDVLSYVSSTFVRRRSPALRWRGQMAQLL